jgi:hypothetical protein
LDFIEAYKSKIPTLRALLAESNFSACSNFGSDLLRAADLVKYEEGVFVGEFFETLFNNLSALNYSYDLKKDDIEKIQKAVNPVFDFLENNMPITDKDKKAEFYSLLVNARYVVTESQLIYFREKKAKSRPPFPMPPSVSIETFEET